MKIQRKDSAMKVWIACLGTLVLLLGITGCSTEKAFVKNSQPVNTPYRSMVGAGPAGRSGPAGFQGTVGDTGARGATTVGVEGSTGSSGYAGPEGPAGQTGPRGPVGIVDRWTSYRTFWFDSDKLNLSNLQSARDRRVEVLLRTSY